MIENESNKWPDPLKKKKGGGYKSCCTLESMLASCVDNWVVWNWRGGGWHGNPTCKEGVQKSHCPFHWHGCCTHVSLNSCANRFILGI